MPTINTADDKFILTASNEILVLPCGRPDDRSIRVSVAASASEQEITKTINQLDIKKENSNITCASLSKCHEYFAVCDDKKNVTVWQSKNWKEFYKQWSLPTKAYAVCFSNDSDRLLVADKSGDVLSFELNPPSDTYTCILGHLSMLLDMVMSSCGKYIITCDRDEKIRVSKYPNAYNIECYCLGHTDFVTNLQVVHNFSENILLSASGDGSLRVWKYLEGKEVGKRNVAQDIELKCGYGITESKVATANDDESDKEEIDETKSTVPAVRHIRCKTSSPTSVTVATVIDRFNGIVLYTLDSEFTFTILTKVSLEASVWDIQFSCKDNDLIALINRCDHVKVFSADGTYAKSDSIFASESKDFLTGKEDTLKSIEQLYKKQLFDNVEQYTILKQKRLQQKCGNEHKNGDETNVNDNSEDVKRLKLDQNKS